MALVIATGVLLGNADSYISVADADAYHASLQNDEWSVVEFSRKEALLRRASIMIDARYRGRWRQPELYTDVPRSLEMATAEAALYSLTQDLLSVQTQNARSVSIGSISVSFDTSQSISQMGVPGTIWDFLDMMLSDVASSSTSSSAVASGWGLLAVKRA